MKFFVFIFIFIIFSACATVSKKRTDKLSILQGITSAREVEFSVLFPKEKILRFELRSAKGDIVNPEKVELISRPHSPWAVYKILFLRNQKEEYNLYAYENEQIIDQRLIGKGQVNRSRLKLAVLSCMNDQFDQHFQIWDTLMSKNPEYVLMIGDNVYANRGPGGQGLSSSPENIWNRYTDVRLTLPFYFQEKLIPVHAVWDDNDYGPKNSNETFEHKNSSKEIFDTFFAQSFNTEIFQKGLGVGGLLSLGDFNLYFLDARFFRSSDSTKSHLGHDQYKWLMKNLKNEAQPSLLIKGDQFFGGYHQYESFEGNHPKEFSHFVTDLRSIQTPFIFLSGDRHLSEILQFPRSLFGLPSFEITSSPMHGKVYDDPGPRGPWRVVHTHGKVNFTMIDNLSQDNHWFMDVENIGENGELYFRRELAVYVKDLQNNLNEVRKKRSGERSYRKIRRKRR